MDDAPCRVSIDLRHHEAAQRPEVTEAQKKEAIRSIIEDYLLLGYSYPQNGGRECVTAGMVAMSCMDDDDLENVLTAVTYGCGDIMESRQQYVETLVRDYAERYLREKCQGLIERRAEELAPEEE